MATITVNASYGLDVRKLDFSSLPWADDYIFSTSLLRAYYSDGYIDEFRGTDFAYSDETGEPIAGTATSYAAFYNGTRLFTVDGARIPVTSIVAATTTDGTSDDQAVIANALKGSDTFKGGNRSDYIKLYGGNDTLLGNGGDDFLFAGTGNDTITGGLGRDRLYGESGSDTFIYKSVKESTVSSTGRDTIYDFTSADTIHLSAIDANTKMSGNQAFSFIGTKAFSGKAGQLRYDKKASDTYIYGDVNGDKKADLAIHLDDAVKLSKYDFIL